MNVGLIFVVTAWLRASGQLEGWRTCFDCGSRSFCVVTCAGKVECHKQAQIALLLSWTLFLFLDHPPLQIGFCLHSNSEEAGLFFSRNQNSLTKEPVYKDGRLHQRLQVLRNHITSSTHKVLITNFKCLDKGGVIIYILVSENNNQLHLSARRWYIGQGKSHNITSDKHWPVPPSLRNWSSALEQFKSNKSCLRADTHVIFTEGLRRVQKSYQKLWKPEVSVWLKSE